MRERGHRRPTCLLGEATGPVKPASLLDALSPNTSNMSFGAMLDASGLSPAALPRTVAGAQPLLQFVFAASVFSALTACFSADRSAWGVSDLSAAYTVGAYVLGSAIYLVGGGSTWRGDRL